MSIEQLVKKKLVDALVSQKTMRDDLVVSILEKHLREVLEIVAKNHEREALDSLAKSHHPEVIAAMYRDHLQEVIDKVIDTTGATSAPRMP